MDHKFKDRQQFNDRLVFAFIFLAFLGMIIAFANTLWTGQFTWTSVLIYLGLMSLLVAWYNWLRRLELKVSINDKRIKFKMTPFHRKAKRIHWNEVASCKLVKTPGVAQWHGSNLHFFDEKWFSLSGRNGLSLVTTEGEAYFIGCKNMEGLARFLRKRRSF